MLGGSAGRATGRDGAVRGRGVAAAAAGAALLRLVVRRAAGFAAELLAVVFLPVERFAVVRLVVLRLAVLRLVVLRFAVDFLPPARFAVLRLAVDFFAFFFAAISPPFGYALRRAFGWWFYGNKDPLFTCDL
jgi:hypothetical protein